MNLKGSLGWKGERGYSAYEIAVKNGYIGSEQDWLATLGTSSKFKEDKIIHTATAGQTVFALPSQYTSNSFIDIFVDGLRLTSQEYTVGTTNITLTNGLSVGSEVEIVVLTMSTNNLPIVTTISSTSTNTTTPGTKAVYDLVNPISTNVTSLQTSVSTLNTEVAKMFDKNNISTLTGTITDISAGGTKSTTVSYPTGFTRTNTIIVSKLVSSNNVYYDANNYEPTASGFPEIDMISLGDSNITVWMKNANTTQTRNGYFKITLMKI